jgi:hypothetical protein
MAKNGGARPGAGRPKGSVSRRSIEVLSAAVLEGVSPVEYMLKILRNENADAKERAWAAEKSAPYLHPRPAPLARAITIDLPDTDTVEGIRAALTRIVQAMGAGEIAPSEGQSLIAVVEAQRKAIETDEILGRIERLEKQMGDQNGARA